MRIFPAYWICLTVIGIACPLVLGSFPNFGFISQNFWLVQRQTVIPPLFFNNPLPKLVNGSFWTLEHEFRAYLLIGLLGFAGVLRRYFILGLLLLVWGVYIVTYYTYQPLMTVFTFRLVAHFLAGAVLYFWQVPLNKQFALVSFAIAVVTLSTNLYPLVSPATTAYLLLWLAIVLPFQRIGRINDYSYGLYIYAFPIQQSLTTYRLNQWGYLSYLLLSVFCTLPLALASWYLVEKPVLSWKNWVGNVL